MAGLKKLPGLCNTTRLELQIVAILSLNFTDRDTEPQTKRVLEEHSLLIFVAFCQSIIDFL